jgi:two-component system, chemotaxis family, protein-glutamate methylesterase/glutaminase
MSRPGPGIEPVVAPEEPATEFDVVAVASSAGGVPALSRLVAELPADFPVPVLVVQHLDRRHRTVIADILDRRSPLLVKLAEHNDMAQAGVVHVAPPNRHLLVSRAGRLTLTDSELVHFVRPSADLLFESVAGSYGARAVAVVLTGSGSDGAMGVRAVKERGGTVIVEDPTTAQFTGMPSAALSTGVADFVLPLAEIGPVVVGLVDQRDQQGQGNPP